VTAFYEAINFAHFYFNREINIFPLTGLTRYVQFSNVQKLNNQFYEFYQTYLT